MSKHLVKCPGCGLEGVLNDEQFSGDASAKCGCGHEWTQKAEKSTKGGDSVQPKRETFGGTGRRK